MLVINAPLNAHLPLEVTICCSLWFMKGFFTEKTECNYRAALEFYRSAIVVLEWGHKEWKEVPIVDRGVIFSPTFVRAIRRFHLEAYMSVCPKFLQSCISHMPDMI